MSSTEIRFPAPEPLGLVKSFGFGDPLGLAAPGHLAAIRRFSFAPVFVGQSLRQLERTGRTPSSALENIRSALAHCGFTRAWSAELTGVKTEEDIDRGLAAGYTLFTLDPSAFVENRADRMTSSDIAEGVAALAKEGILPSGALQPFLGKSYALPTGGAIVCEPVALMRAAVKFARAVSHAQRMARHLSRVSPFGRWELSLDLGETDSPTSDLEHLFVATDCRRRNIALTVLTPRLPGQWRRGADFVGDLAEVENTLRRHAAIASVCGPYKLGIRHASEKFSVYPILGRACGDRVHLATSGTAYLEALRVVARTAPELFHEIALLSHARYDRSLGSVESHPTAADVSERFRLSRNAPAEEHFLNHPVGRQVLHTGCNAVLAEGRTSRGRAFREAILEVVVSRIDLYTEILDAHFTRTLGLLNQG